MLEAQASLEEVGSVLRFSRDKEGVVPKKGEIIMGKKIMLGIVGFIAPLIAALVLFGLTYLAFIIIRTVLQ